MHAFHFVLFQLVTCSCLTGKRKQRKILKILFYYIKVNHKHAETESYLNAKILLNSLSGPTTFK